MMMTFESAASVRSSYRISLSGLDEQELILRFKTFDPKGPTIRDIRKNVANCCGLPYHFIRIQGGQQNLDTTTATSTGTYDDGPFLQDSDYLSHFYNKGRVIFDFKTAAPYCYSKRDKSDSLEPKEDDIVNLNLEQKLLLNAYNPDLIYSRIAASKLQDRTNISNSLSLTGGPHSWKSESDFFATNDAGLRPKLHYNQSILQEMLLRNANYNSICAILEQQQNFAGVENGQYGAALFLHRDSYRYTFLHLLFQSKLPDSCCVELLDRAMYTIAVGISSRCKSEDHDAKIGGYEAIRDFLMGRDMFNHTYLHFIKPTHPMLFSRFLSYASQYLSNGQLNTMFKAHDTDKGENFLHRLCSRKSSTDDNNRIETAAMFEFIRQHIESDILRKLLLSKNKYSETPVHIAAKSKNQWLLSRLLSLWVQEKVES